MTWRLVYLYVKRFTSLSVSAHLLWVSYFVSYVMYPRFGKCWECMESFKSANIEGANGVYPLSRFMVFSSIFLIQFRKFHSNNGCVLHNLNTYQMIWQFNGKRTLAAHIIIRWNTFYNSINLSHSLSPFRSDWCKPHSSWVCTISFGFWMPSLSTCL